MKTQGKGRLDPLSVIDLFLWQADQLPVRNHDDYYKSDIKFHLAADELDKSPMSVTHDLSFVLLK